MNLSEDIKIVSALDYASGTATREGATLDTQRWEGVLFVTKFGTIADSAVGDVHMEQGDDSGLTDAADLEGTAQAVAHDDDNQIFVIDLVKPMKRYVRGVVTKDGSHAMAEMAFYILYGPGKKPTTMAVTDLVNYEKHVSPAEGTK